MTGIRAPGTPWPDSPSTPSESPLNLAGDEPEMSHSTSDRRSEVLWLISGEYPVKQRRK